MKKIITLSAITCAVVAVACAVVAINHKLRLIDDTDVDCPDFLGEE